MNIETGTIINQYKIISAIGKGGMGEVFLADDTKLKRQVALKILPPEFAEDKDRMSRFVREAQSASALNHPNIITIYEIGESEGTHFIATEFIDGKTLNDYKRANPLNYKSALEIAIQVASALDEAHSAGIVHRDIKPDNVMIRANGLAKILDFGIAKVTAISSSDEEAATAILAQTQAGMIIGTPNYMSPEQARGKDVDHQTDIFSFGVVFYEMLSGSSPFSGETVSDVIAAVLTKVPKRLSDIPIELAEILNKTLEKDKKNRYQTAKDLLADLQEAKEELSVQSRLERTSSPNLEEPKTQILQAVTTAETDSNKSIAVLPFTNMSADEDNEYFCEGLAEELLNALSKINDLKVAARTSAFSFKGKNANVSEIGEKLGVKNVLEGSVRKSGSKLRISVQLVNASDGYQLWSERYDREMEDIFDVQDEIALAVVDALKLKLFRDEKAAVLKRGTENKESFQLYLKGRYHFAKRTKEDHFKAIDYFQRAVALDSNFALAYVGIADAYNSMVKGSDISQKEAISQSKAAAAKALEIDPTLAEAHVTLADSLAIDWNWKEAELEFKRSLELNPNLAYTCFAYGSSFLVPMGRTDEAVKELKRAVELDPVSLINNAVLVSGYLYARQNDKALEQGFKTYDLEPNFRFGLQWLEQAYIADGNYAEAIALSENVLKKLPFAQENLAMAGQAYAKSGQRHEAEQYISRLKEMAKTQTVRFYWIAAIYAALGDKDKAFAELEKSYQERDWFLPRLKVDPIFDSLHDDERFEDLLNRIGLPTAKTNRTDESLEAKTVMLTSEPPAIAGGLTQSTQEPNRNSTTSNTNLQPSATAKPSSDKSRKTKYLAAGLLTLLLTVGGFFGYKSLSPTTTQINSIAVLPFENRSGNADSEYLSDGLAESLIYRLSQLPDLKVSPTSSVFRYKGKETDPQIVAKELGVDSVMTGRITQRGDNLTISVNLVDTRNGIKSLWGEQYERKMSELLNTQREIASEITNKLQLKLSGAGEQKLTKKYTDNNEAYQLYLKGRFYWNKRDEENLRKAIEQFKAATDKDPNFALAFVGLADCYLLLPYYSDSRVASTEALRQAKSYVSRALEIDESLGEAHASLGFCSWQSWNWAESEKSFNRSIELNPNYAPARQWFAQYLQIVGRDAEAETEYKRAIELEPLSPILYHVLALHYTRKGDLKAAEEQCQRAIELNPNWYYIRFNLALVYAKQGRNAEAIAEAEKSVEWSKRQGIPLGVLGYIYAKAGRQSDAIKIVEELKERYQKQQADGIDIARVYIEWGDKDQAFVWLEKEFQSRNPKLPLLLGFGWFDALRDDPRYKDLLKRMNLPE